MEKNTMKILLASVMIVAGAGVAMAQGPRGMTFDQLDVGGNVYITAMTDNALGVTKPDGTYEVLFQSDSDLPWPDGFAIGADGFVYATINELHRSPVLNGGTDASLGTYRIVRFPALDTAISGR